MIGSRPRLGSGFKGLQQYLQHGRAGASPDRAVWTATRNLPGGDPERAAQVMRLTANSSLRVERPVYHLSVSLAPGERLDRAQLERVADRLLKDLGLQEHQALIAEHADGAQQHIHLMVNRVHPDSARAWKTWRDYERIERSLRAQERELGLQVVPGRHAPVPGRVRYVGTRESARPFAAQVRELVGEPLRTAPSWQDLHASLTRHGLSLRPGRSGRGLAITDGRRWVAASKVSRGASRGRLEARLGEYQPASRDLLRLQRVARELERRGRLDALQRRYQAAVRDLGQALVGHQRAAEGLARADRRLDKVLGRAFREPAGARARIDRELAERGAPATLARLRKSPGHFGKLRGRAVPGNAERAAARRALGNEIPRSIRRLAQAQTAERSALQRLERFRRNPKRPVLESAHRAKRVLDRALRRLQQIDRRIAPLKRIAARASVLVARVGWRTVAKLIPHPAFQALRVTVSLVRAPGRVLDRMVER